MKGYMGLASLAQMECALRRTAAIQADIPIIEHIIHLIKVLVRSRRLT